MNQGIFCFCMYVRVLCEEGWATERGSVGVILWIILS